MIARAGVGWVPDDRRIFPGLTVARNLEIARKAGRFSSWGIDELFGLFPALRHLMAREADNLSGGEAQMVAIARALVWARRAFCCSTSRRRAWPHGSPRS